MFKRQLLQQARACRTLRASPSPLTVLAAQRPAAASCRPAVLASSLDRVNSTRYYSAASAAEASSQNGSAAGRITRFADLTSVGVHENIVRTLTENMKYENMTDVQSMSINPALQGKDMYVGESVPRFTVCAWSSQD